MVSKNVKTLALLGGGLYAASRLTAGESAGGSAQAGSENIGILKSGDGTYVMEADTAYDDTVEWTLTNQETNETLTFTGNPVTGADIPPGTWTVNVAGYQSQIEVF